MGLIRLRLHYSLVYLLDGVDVLVIYLLLLDLWTQGLGVQRQGKTDP